LALRHFHSSPEDSTVNQRKKGHLLLVAALALAAVGVSAQEAKADDGPQHHLVLDPIDGLYYCLGIALDCSVT
jgi:hypothetical protein